MQAPPDIQLAIENLRIKQNVMSTIAGIPNEPTGTVGFPFCIVDQPDAPPTPKANPSELSPRKLKTNVPSSPKLTIRVHTPIRAPSITETARVVAEQTDPRRIRIVSYREMSKEASDAGFKAVVTDFFKSIWRERRELEPDTFADTCGPEYIEALRYNNELRARVGKPPRDSDPDTDYYLITVNPRDGTPLDSLLRLLAKSLSKQWIVDSAAKWLYVIEQRGTDSRSPRGLHAHILLERPRYNGSSRYPWSKFQTEIKNTFKSLVGGGPQRHLINIQPVKRTVEKVVAYMMGDKEDGKMEAQTATEEWRREINLKPYYTNMEEAEIYGNPPSARSEEADDEGSHEYSQSQDYEDEYGDEDEIEELN